MIAKAMRKILVILFLLWGSVAYAASGLFYSRLILITTGLTAYYHLDQASGNFSAVVGTTCTASGGGITYQVPSGILDTSGDTAAKFDGTTGTCAYTIVNGSDPAYINTETGAGWAVEVWLKPTDMIFSPSIVMSNSRGSPAGRQWRIENFSDGGMEVEFFGAGTSGLGCNAGDHGAIITAPGYIDDLHYHQIVVQTIGGGTVTCGDTNPCNTLAGAKFYFDGHLIDKTTSFNTTDIEHSMCGTPLLFNMTAFPPLSEFGKSSVDEVSFYKSLSGYPLDDVQVLCHYRTYLGEPCATWPFTASIEEENGKKSTSG